VPGPIPVRAVEANLAQYFDRPDAPARHSPVGILISKLVERHPDLSFEQARVRANALLDKAAGKRVYKFPRVPTEEQRQAQVLRLAVMQSKKSQTAPQNADSCNSGA
jgi:hypothetical protein